MAIFESLRVRQAYLSSKAPLVTAFLRVLQSIFIAHQTPRSHIQLGSFAQYNVTSRTNILNSVGLGESHNNLNYSINKFLPFPIPEVEWFAAD